MAAVEAVAIAAARGVEVEADDRIRLLHLAVLGVAAEVMAVAAEAVAAGDRISMLLPRDRALGRVRGAEEEIVRAEVAA